MSSHHFVREGQEPELYLAALPGAKTPLLEGLLEWSPRVWCGPGEHELLSQWGHEAQRLDQPWHEHLAALGQPSSVYLADQPPSNALLNALAHMQPAPVLYHESYKAVLLTEKGFAKWFPARQVVGLLPVETGQVTATKGLEPSYHGATIDHLHYCTCPADGQVHLKGSGLWVLEVTAGAAQL